MLGDKGCQECQGSGIVLNRHGNELHIELCSHERLRPPPTRIADGRPMMLDFVKGAVERGRRLERAAIVAWLRKNSTYYTAPIFADDIERGEHEKGEDK